MIFTYSRQKIRNNYLYETSTYDSWRDPEYLVFNISLALCVYKENFACRSLVNGNSFINVIPFQLHVVAVMSIFVIGPNSLTNLAIWLASFITEFERAMHGTLSEIWLTITVKLV